MATITPTCLFLVLVRGNSDSVPVSFDLNSDGVAYIFSSRLAARFGYREHSLHVDLDAFNADGGVITHSVSQVPVFEDMFDVWHLKAGQYRVYGTRENVHASRALVTDCAAEVTPLLRKVKTESSKIPVIKFSNGSNTDCPSHPHTSQNSNSANASRLVDDSTAPQGGYTSKKPPLPPSATLFRATADSPISVGDAAGGSTLSVIDCLRQLHMQKGSKSVLSRLDYNTIPIQVVQSLPTQFDGDIIFELPP